MIFEKNQKIADYTVLFPHKESDYAETYRVKSSDGKTLFLKLICYTKLKSSQFNNDGKIIEVGLLEPALASIPTIEVGRSWILEEIWKYRYRKTTGY